MFDEHPKTQAHAQRHRELKEALAAARRQHSELAARRDASREALRNRQATAFRTTGPSAPLIVDDQAAQLEAEIVRVSERVTTLERALGQHVLDGRLVGSQVRDELTTEVRARAVALVSQIGRLFDDLEPLVEELEGLRCYGLVSLPLALPLLHDAMSKFRAGSTL